MPVIEYNIKITRGGRPITERIKRVYVKLGQIPGNLSDIKEDVLRAT